MDNYLKFITKESKLSTVHDMLRTKKENNILLNGIDNPVNAYFAMGLKQDLNKYVIIVENNLFNAQKTYDLLTASFPNENIFFYPMDEFIFVDTLAQSLDLLEERIETLNNISNNKKGIIVTHTSGITRFLPPKKEWSKFSLNINLNTIIDITDFLDKVVKMGYKRETIVESVGEFSVRGGIVDIYPITENHPVRIEFFDDEIDSIRKFNVENQRTISMLDKIIITPVGEFVYDDDVRDKALNKIRNKLKNSSNEELINNINEDINDLENRNNVSKLYRYINYFYEDLHTILDYLDDYIVIYSNYPRIVDSYKNSLEDIRHWYESMFDSNKILNDNIDYFCDLAVAENKCSNNIYTQTIGRGNYNRKFTAIEECVVKHLPDYNNDIKYTISELKRMSEQKKVLLSFEHVNRMDRFTEELNNNDIAYTLINNLDDIYNNKINITTTSLLQGFELPNDNFVLITSHELFKHKERKIKYRSTLKDAVKIDSYEQLNIGDFVVHYEHGIGQYLGIETLLSGGTNKDFLQIAYSGGDKLYVPVEKIDLIQKYIGSEGHKPKIHKIGGTAWAKSKQRAQKRIKDIAGKLIQLYAKREQEIGYAFSIDTEDQNMFENEFPYIETNDQLVATEEIKKDMENIKPMDRLLCGDVGYGKTEVAMRAAFKALMDGKQVAYLAPTTILTQQHYQTFTERFKNYPINIGLLNRFVPKGNVSKIIHNTKKGKIDILIGTHRLLSKDIEFKDLGLLIVDEEQRFGVEHKERIKEFKVNVDVLTLTATPIPRTLQMSLVGIRGLSTLNTPPANRYPIQTYVLQHNEVIIREGIERELARDGQVFYLYNRTSDIDQVALKIQELVPDARVTYAHGQMSREELEDRMISFMDKKYDVLVSTTIIETGIDIANANTLIISDSHRLGLSQLYQLRGRVGRSDRIAYAYLLYPPHKVLSVEAEKRLQAIKEFTELGSGYKIAMRDLAIRGSGDLLGTQQYGFIDDVGFELYTKMLKDAVDKFKGNVIKDLEKDESNIKISISLEAYIPNTYIDNESLKIYVYKKIKNIDSFEDVTDIEEEIIDRFGDYSDSVQNLINVSYIKNSAISYNFESITETKKEVEFIISEEESSNIDGEKLFTTTNNISRFILIKYLNNKLHITYKKGKDKKNWSSIFRDLFSKYNHVRKL